MKKLLLCSLISFFPIFPVLAEEGPYYLILLYAPRWYPAFESIPMKTLDECELAGAKLKASKRFAYLPNAFSYECVKGGKS